MGPPESSERASWLAARAGDLFLRLSVLSRLWPVRSMTQQHVKRLGGTRFGVDGTDGATIDALHIPARANQPRRLPVFFAHGWLETKEFHLYEARLLSSRGHDVVLIDSRRHGRSTGAFITFGVKEKQDVAAVIDAAQRRGWVEDHVITVGYSLGAATMLQHAGVDPRVAGVVAMAPFNTMADAVKSFQDGHGMRFGYTWLRRGFDHACRRLGFDMADASPAAVMDRLHVPALFIVGERDRLLPPQLHTRLLAQAKVNGQCRYLTIPGAGHIDLCLRRWRQKDAAIVEFCAQVSSSQD